MWERQGYLCRARLLLKLAIEVLFSRLKQSKRPRAEGYDSVSKMKNNPIVVRERRPPGVHSIRIFGQL